MEIKSMNGCYINHQTVLSTFDIAIKLHGHACVSIPALLRHNKICHERVRLMCWWWSRKKEDPVGHYEWTLRFI